MARIEQVVCLRCGYKWFPRSTVKPKNCSRCNSPYWDKPRKNIKDQVDR